jgi:lipopolysaccharide export LptBFGC system permease protein LptF
MGLLLCYELKTLAREIAAMPGGSFRLALPILLTLLPDNLSTTLPMAAVLGGLMGTQQMSEGSELVASHGLGAGRRTLLVPWLTLALGLWTLGTLNAHWFVPAANRVQERLRRQMQEEGFRQALRSGDRPYYPKNHPDTAFWLAPNQELHQLRANETEVSHLVAKAFQWRLDPANDRVVYLNLRDVSISRHLRDSGKNQRGGLAEQTIPAELPAPQRLLPPTPLRYQPTPNLLRDRSVDSWKELSRRITLPLAAMALLLMGIALGVSHPRFHKGGALIRSLGVIILYYILLTFTENAFASGRFSSPLPLFCLPFLFGAAAFLLLQLKLRPHHANRVQTAWARVTTRLLQVSWGRWLWLRVKTRARAFRLRARRTSRATPPSPHSGHILRAWTSRSWFQNWLGAMAIFLTLDFLIEFATLAGDLAANHVSMTVFLQYWYWNLPEFLALALPLAFLFGGVMTFSEASATHEWVALRAGGVSLIQWVRAGFWTWSGILCFTLVLQAGLAPLAIPRKDHYYARIKNRQEAPAGQVRPWLHLSSTGVLWHLEEGMRWGFPLRSPGEAPALLRWETNESSTEALPWGGLAFQEGPALKDLFPAQALRDYDKPERVSTRDLFQWQRWAPEADRGTLLWSRLLAWLSGPCLLFAAASFAFPRPRQGRGQALGLSLILGLLFTGAQMIFGDAARTGEIPPLWGVLLPLLLCLSVGLLRLPRLRT